MDGRLNSVECREFSPSDDKILNMESDLLFGSFENDRTSQEIQEHIRAMSCGKAVFQAKTLGFVYHRLSTKKRDVIRGSVRLEPHGTPEPSRRIPLKPTPGESETMVRCAREPRVHVYTLSELLQGLYCPVCDDRGENGTGRYGRPFTHCTWCYTLRVAADLRCIRCGTLFKSDL